MRIEDEVVRALERHLAASAVENIDGAGREIDPFDPPAAVIARLRQRADTAAFAVPFEAAIIGDVAFAVGADRGAVRAAAGAGDDALRPVRQDPGQRAG